MPDSNRRSPEKPTEREGVPKAELEYFKNLYKNIQYLEFSNLPFKKKKTNPLIPELKKLQKITHKLSAAKLIDLYKNFAEKGLYQENCLVRRVFLGELLKRLDINSKKATTVEFIKLMIKESEKIKPLLVKQIKRIESLLGSDPKARQILFKWAGITDELEKEKMTRPGDPLFDDNEQSFKKAVDSHYGPIEDVKPYVDVGEVMSMDNLDPFQIILYKRLLQGYNELARVLLSELKPLFQYRTPYYRQLHAKMHEALYKMRIWIQETVEKMSVNEVENLAMTYKNQVKKLSFPSIPNTINVPAPFVAKLIPGLRGKVLKIEKLLTGFRSKMEKEVKNALLSGVPVIERIQVLMPLLKKELSRKKMYRTHHNRAFLNRFWDLAHKKYKNASGDNKYKYEFFTMVLDSIESDNELVSIIDRIKPILVEILKNSPDAEKLSKAYLEKSFSELSDNEINSLLYLLLPSEKVTVMQQQSDKYKEMKNTLVSMLKLVDLESIKKNQYSLYVAIKTVTQNLLNIYISISETKSIPEAKQKLGKFIYGFENLNKLLGKKNINMIEDKNQMLANLLKNPANAVKLMRKHWLVPNTIKKAVKEFEELHSIEQPKIVKKLLSRARDIKKYLLKQKKIYGKKSLEMAKQGAKLDVNALGVLSTINSDLQNIEKAIDVLILIQDMDDFRSQEYKINKYLLSTRYIKVPEETLKNISVLEAHENLSEKPDYSSMIFVSNEIQKYTNGIIKNLYREGGNEDMYPRISGVIRDLILSFGNIKQKEIEEKGIDVYSFLTTNGQSMAKEIAHMINEFLKGTKITDKNNELVSALHVTGAFDKHIYRYMKRNIFPKAKKAVDKRG